MSEHFEIKELKEEIRKLKNTVKLHTSDLDNVFYRLWVLENVDEEPITTYRYTSDDNGTFFEDGVVVS